MTDHEANTRAHALRIHQAALDGAERQYQDLTGTDKAFKKSTGTCACPRCGHCFEPDPMDFEEVGPLPSQQDGDGPRDRVIECPGCGAVVGEFDLEDPPGGNER